MTLGTTRSRRAILNLSLGVGLAALAWAAILFASGGIDLALGTIRIASHDPLRPLMIGALGLTAYLMAGGWPATFLAAAARVRARIEPRVHSRHVAWALAVTVCAIGIAYNTRAIGGADSYGYVSEAELWLHGHPRIDQAFALDAPWPDPQWTFAPPGYSPNPDNPRLIVPNYPPGLPLILAGAKFIGGQDALFCVMPLGAALLVLATYGIGGRLGSGRVGAIGAWLVATSPPVLFMSMTPMTDVPVAGVIASSVYCLLGTSAWSGAGAGLLAGLAILIRPNVLPLVAILGLRYLLVREKPKSMPGIDFRKPMPGIDFWRRAGHAALFALGAVPGIAALALINKDLYGAAVASGYGGFNLFHWAHVPPNFRNYLHSLVDTHTPFVLLGVLAVFVPLRAFWPGVRDRRVFVVFGLFVVALWLMYCAYDVFDAWWYLRYMLPSWPFMMLGVGALIMAVHRAGGSFVKPAVIGAALMLGAWQVRVAADRFTFLNWQGERRFIVAAQLTAKVTRANSVVLAGPHAGSIRYYGGRMTMRYDQLHPAWLDRAVEWLKDRGVHTYLVVEDWEIPEIRDRFAGATHLAALDRPIAIYAEPGRLLIFDLTDPPSASGSLTMATGFDTGTGWRAARPVVPPQLILGSR